MFLCGLFRWHVSFLIIFEVSSIYNLDLTGPSLRSSSEKTPYKQNIMTDISNVSKLLTPMEIDTGIVVVWGGLPESAASTTSRNLKH